jgi:hypothetical protein
LRWLEFQGGAISALFGIENRCWRSDGWSAVNKNSAKAKLFYMEIIFGKLPGLDAPGSQGGGGQGEWLGPRQLVEFAVGSQLSSFGRCFGTMTLADQPVAGAGAFSPEAGRS